MQPQMRNNYFYYLPISRYNIVWELYLTGIGLCNSLPHMPYPPRGHPELYDFNWDKGRVLPEYQVITISQGEGTFESTQTGICPIKAGQVLLLFPGVWHRYRPSDRTGWCEHWLSWNGEYLYRLTRRGLMSPRRPILDLSDQLNPVLKVHNRLLETVSGQSAENSHVLAAWALELLSLVLEADDRTERKLEHEHTYPHGIKDPIVGEAVKYIWSHSYRDLSVTDLVRHLPATRRTLERKFKQELGHSIGTEIKRCRIERARHLLEQTRLPIEHIALAAGFSGADRMGKVFQQEAQTTPGGYRKRIKNTTPADNSDSNFEE